MSDPFLMAAAFALIFAPIEGLVPFRRPPDFSWRRYRTDLLHLFVGGYMIRFGTAASLAVVVNFTGQLGHLSSFPIWLQCIGVLVVADAGVWIAHRLHHAVPWLWRFHRIHHSSEHLDWLAAYRFHPVDQIINLIIVWTPLFALGFSSSALMIYAFAYQCHALLLHSNTRSPFGPISRIFVSPRFHRWHHANEPQAVDKNFGAQLVIWDWLASTLYYPDREPARFGLNDPPDEDFVRHLAEPFCVVMKEGSRRSLRATTGSVGQ